MFISQVQTLRGQKHVSVSSVLQLLIFIASRSYFAHNRVALGAASLRCLL